MPEQITQSDVLGRLPLHIATGCRCSSPTVRILVDLHPDACLARDDDGKTPLILACDAECELFEGDDLRTRGPPSFDVVRILVRCVRSVPLEDSDGMSALEHAIISDAPLKVVQMLQYVERRLGEGECAKRQRQQENASGGSNSTTATNDVPTTVVVKRTTEKADQPSMCEIPRRVSKEELCGGASPAKRRRSSFVDVRIASMHAMTEEWGAVVRC